LFDAGVVAGASPFFLVDPAGLAASVAAVVAVVVCDVDRVRFGGCGWSSLVVSFVSAAFGAGAAVAGAGAAAGLGASAAGAVVGSVAVAAVGAGAVSVAG
jgi:hypothetical protein